LAVDLARAALFNDPAGALAALAVPLFVGLTNAQAFLLVTALVLVIAGLPFARAAELAALLAKLPQAVAELVELLPDAVDLLLDLLDAAILIAAAGDPALLLLLRRISLLVVAGLPGLIVLLPALAAALLIAGKRLVPRFKLAADHDFFTIAVDCQLNLVSRGHVANLGDELLRGLNLLTVDLRDAIAFLDPHLLGRRIGEDAHDSDTLARAFTDDVHAETGILVVAAAAELARLTFTVDVILLLAELAALLAELPAPLRFAAELLTAELALAARFGEAILLTRLLPILLPILLPGLLTILLPSLLTILLPGLLTILLPGLLAVLLTVLLSCLLTVLRIAIFVLIVLLVTLPLLFLPLTFLLLTLSFLFVVLLLALRGA
jgi:hypothetical protein